MEHKEKTKKSSCSSVLFLVEKFGENDEKINPPYQR